MSYKREERHMKGLTFGAIMVSIALLPGSALAQPVAHGKRGQHKRSGHVQQTKSESGQPVIDWNQTLLSIVNTPGAQPATLQPTRNFAILHAAIYDAVNAIDRSHEPYVIFARAPRDASE